MAYKATSVSQLIEIMQNMQNESRMSQAQYANSINISPQYLCDIYAGRRDPGQSVLNALSVSRSVEYTIPDNLASYSASLTNASPVAMLQKEDYGGENQNIKEKGKSKGRRKGKGATR